MSNTGDRTAEGTGFVASDSLAAESLRGNTSEGFASNERAERGPAPSSQPARSTTTNTTDTSGATELESAAQRQDRLSETELQGKNYRTPAQEPGLDKFADSSTGEAGGRAYNTSIGGPQESLGDAPAAYAPQSRATEEQLKPKGRNLQEVSNFGSAEDAPNASMQYGNEIGGKRDPGRVAEQGFENLNAKSAGDAGYPTAGKQGAQMDQGGFESLNTEENA